LAANERDWTLEKVLEAVQGKEDNVQVNLARSIPVLILYATAVVNGDGAVHFSGDVESHAQECHTG
jgi:murein L,D-transpeptidase YcbB/YkuD